MYKLQRLKETSKKAYIDQKGRFCNLGLSQLTATELPLHLLSKAVD